MRTFNNIVVGAGVPSSLQVMEVEVDTWLRHVRVQNAYAGSPSAKLPRILAASQATGSVIQGIGYALYEAREMPGPATAHEQHGGLPHSGSPTCAAGAFR